MVRSLVLLISEQTLPNVLTAIQYQPQKIYLIHSENPRLQTGMDKLVAYLKARIPSLILRGVRAFRSIGLGSPP